MPLTPREARAMLATAIRLPAERWPEKPGLTWVPQEVSSAAEDAVDALMRRVDPTDQWWHYFDRDANRMQIPTHAILRERFLTECLDEARAQRDAVRLLPPDSRVKNDPKSQRVRQLRAKRDEMRRREAVRLLDGLKQFRELRAIQVQERLEHERELEREAAEAALRAEEGRARVIRERSAPPPAAQPYGVSHAGAEHLVRDWMRHLGVIDATVTRLQHDGGIDVESERFIAQVKNYSRTVPVEEVRSLGGVAAAFRKEPLMFTSGDLTIDGFSFAAQVRMAVLRYDAVAGSLMGLNQLGLRCVEVGVHEAFDAM